MKKTPTIEPKKLEPGTGTARCQDENGKLRMPPPYIEKNSPEQVAAEAVPDDPLPLDLREALAVQKQVNELSDKTPGKEHRLQRIGRHLSLLQHGTPPPTLTLDQLKTQLRGLPATKEEQARALATL